MGYILDGMTEAMNLLLSLDKEVYSIVLLSIFVSLTSTFISTVLGIPIGFVLGVKKFRFKKLFTRVLNTSMSLPPVVVGLAIAILLSRRGPFGDYRLLFTPTAMIIAQTILVLPITTGIIFNSAKVRGRSIIEICKTLGGSKRHMLLLFTLEMRRDIVIAIATGFGRAISEVGAVMIVGGNIKGHTRVMTSFIAMNNSMGNYSMSIAMGLVLLLLAFLTNSILHFAMAED